MRNISLTRWAGFGRFARDTEAVAVVEFALILPLLLMLYVGSIEASALFTADRKVLVISSTTGDLVSRWDPALGTMPQATMTDYFRAAEGIIVPYQVDGLEQVVSLVSVAANGTATVSWSIGYNGAPDRADGSPYPLAANTEMNQLARGGCLVASETTYPYLPVLGLVFTNVVTLTRETFYVPRFEECIDEPGT